MSTRNQPLAERTELTPAEVEQILDYARRLGSGLAIDRLLLGEFTVRQVAAMIEQDNSPPVLLRLFTD